ncbi:MAG: hypothetical protein JWR37_2125 [Mycobacterium sp.]|nr:hypothetical protein [Mycobacterium sp.]
MVAEQERQQRPERDDAHDRVERPPGQVFRYLDPDCGNG